MYKVSNEYLTASNSLVRNSRTKIVLDGITYDGFKYIKTYPIFSHENESAIGGFPVKSCAFDFWIKEGFVDFTNKEFTIYKGLVINNSTIEWVPQGIFKAKTEDIKTSDSGLYLSIKAYDRAEAMGTIQYIDSESYPCEELMYIRNVLSKYGYKLEDENFPHDGIITDKPNYKNNVSLREVVSRFAEMRGCIALFSRNGKVQIKVPTETGLKYYFYQYKNLKKERKFGEIDRVVLGNKGFENNVIFPDKDILEISNYDWIINDNPFFDLIKKNKIEEVFDRIKNISFYPFKLNNLLDNFLLDINDVIEIQQKDGTWFKTTILSIKTINRIRCDIGAETQNKLQVNYNLAGSMKNAINEVRLEADNNKNRINALVSEQEEQSSKIAQLQIDKDSIKEQVSSISKTIDNVDGQVSEIENTFKETITSNNAQFESINKTLIDGVEKLKNGLVTIDINGINVSTNIDNFKALFSNKSVLISDSGKEIAFFGYDDNLKKTIARIKELESEKITAGYHRCEPFTVSSEKRTGWFYVG